MREETVRDNLTKQQLANLASGIQGSKEFRVIPSGKNFWYVGLASDEGPAKWKLKPTPFSFGQPMVFDGFEPQTYVGFVGKSRAGLVAYKEGDSRAEMLKNKGYYDKLRQFIQEL